VVLSSCQSAQLDQDELESGLVMSLASYGISNVIGMSQKISDKAGIVFATEFMRQVAIKSSIAYAVQKGREEVAKLDAPFSEHWHLPLLVSQDISRGLVDWDFEPTLPSHEKLNHRNYFSERKEFRKKQKVKEQRNRVSTLSSSIYSSHVWLKREETIPLSLAQDFIRNSAWWLTHPSGPVRAKKHAYNIYKNEVHGWAIDFGANKFLVGKAIERCKNEINKYIEEFESGTKSIELDSLKLKLRKHISGAVATYNNGEYSGYYPISGNDLEFGTQAIDVKDGVNFLIRELGLDKFLEI